MSKHLRIEYPNGHVAEYTKAQRFAANSAPLYGSERLFVAGGEVSLAEFRAEVDALCAAAIEKKERTHERVRVRHGASAASFITKWVRKAGAA